MVQKNRKTRLQYLQDLYNVDYEKYIRSGLYKKISTNRTERKEIPISKNEEINFELYYDPQYWSFLKNFDTIESESGIPENLRDSLFEFFVSCDPTINKEYVSWFLNLYKREVKERIKFKTLVLEGEVKADDLQPSTLFEDLITKVKDGLDVFSFLKKTTVLKIESRDINRFTSIQQFMDLARPYMVMKKGKNSKDVHTLNHDEITCIENYVNYKASGANNGKGLAELAFENDNWIVVITHDKVANSIFGENTTWCTAGTKYGTGMFDSYYSKGYLFVLIKKGFGSYDAIKKEPSVRLQFQFESNAYMNAEDRIFDINGFLHDNTDIKAYFRNYIVNTVLPKRSRERNNKQSDAINFLLKLGYGDDIIQIFKESKPTTVDFSDFKLESEYLERIGEIESIEDLNLTNCDLEYLPLSIENLKNLKSIKFRGNKKIKEIPTWMGSLKKLQILDCAACDIQKTFDASENKNLIEIVMDGNVSMKELPKNLGTLNLTRLTAASCDILEIEDSVLKCEKLFMLDVNSNVNLTKIPLGISKIPTIVAICLDETNVSDEDIQYMKKNNNGKVTIIKYGVKMDK